MLKDWNRKVRMTSAMINACAMTLRVSRNPPARRFAAAGTPRGFSFIGCSASSRALPRLRHQRACGLRLRAGAAHPRQQFGRRPGVRRQAVLLLHRLDRDAALLAEHAVDLADIESGAHQE